MAEKHPLLTSIMRRAMEPGEPRISKTVALVAVAALSAWMGEFSGRQSHGLRNWIAFAICALVLAGALIKLLRDFWKSDANRS